jgi:hypothetical protein
MADNVSPLSKGPMSVAFVRSAVDAKQKLAGLCAECRRCGLAHDDAPTSDLAEHLRQPVHPCRGQGGLSERSLKFWRVKK